jgi:hypothetical protein
MVAFSNGGLCCPQSVETSCAVGAPCLQTVSNLVMLASTNTLAWWQHTSSGCGNTTGNCTHALFLMEYQKPSQIFLHNHTFIIIFLFKIYLFIQYFSTVWLKNWHTSTPNGAMKKFTRKPEKLSLL